MTRILIPLQALNGENSPIAHHFGRAPYFAIVEVDQNKDVTNITAEINNSVPAGGTEDLEGVVLGLKPDYIIANFMGPHIADTFRSVGIKIVQAGGASIKDNLSNYKQDSLKNLAANCPGHP
jgi:predicted Fe-Mo cluster-binding NifX family protein